MRRVSRCNGVKVIPHPWSEAALNLYYGLIVEIRKQFIEDVKRPELWDCDVLYGRRAACDVDVLLTLRSWATEKEFVFEPLTWIVDALQDCAARDYHYAYEKKWDDDGVADENANAEQE